MKYTYKYKKHKLNSNGNRNNNGKKKLRNKTKKHTKSNKTQKLHKLNNQQHKQQHRGGTRLNINTKEKFEVHSLKNFDYDKYKLANKADIDWSSIGGPPPEPNCCIC